MSFSFLLNGALRFFAVRRLLRRVEALKHRWQQKTAQHARESISDKVGATLRCLIDIDVSRFRLQRAVLGWAALRNGSFLAYLNP